MTNECSLKKTVSSLFIGNWILLVNTWCFAFRSKRYFDIDLEAHEGRGGVGVGGAEKLCGLLPVELEDDGGDRAVDGLAGIDRAERGGAGDAADAVDGGCELAAAEGAARNGRFALAFDERQIGHIDLSEAFEVVEVRELHQRLRGD